MSDSRDSHSSGGVGLLGLLQIAFIVLKLLDKISWSWIWVLAPTWIPIVLFILIVIFIVRG